MKYLLIALLVYYIMGVGYLLQSFLRLINEPEYFKKYLLKGYQIFLLSPIWLLDFILSFKCSYENYKNPEVYYEREEKMREKIYHYHGSGFNYDYYAENQPVEERNNGTTE